MLWSALILLAVLVIFTLGKSPIFRVDRAGAAIIGAVATVGTGVLSFPEAILAVDFRTVIILFSMMIVVANLKLAGFFELMGNAVCQHVNSKKQLLFAIIMVSGIMSALAINDIVCLLFTPVVLFICKKTQCNPLPHLLGVAMASNIGSAATLLGNPQNILVGSLSTLSFFAYFIAASPVALIGLLATYAAITYYYREELKGSYFPVPVHNTTVHRYLLIKTFIILFSVLFAYMSGYDLALSASLGGALLLITRRVKPNKVYTSVDFNLLIIFIGLFIVVAGIEHSGLMNMLLNHLFVGEINNMGLFATLTLIVSNIVSNVPAVLLLKFLIPSANADYWWKALALFSTLAGNLTITGSIANLIVVEIAKGEQVQITARDYFKVGFPLTLLTTAIGVLWL
jgi:Na+/H+ antiporter NhaD/arsenite permease-like protein